MTEILQKTENVAKNVANENSQDLTEQWKKGELEKCKDYYVKYGDYEMSLTLDGDNDFIFYGRPIKPKILAPVPSYEEWKNFENANTNLFDAVKMLVKDNFLLEKQNAEIKETNEALESELKEVCDVLIRKCPEMKEWVMLNWKNLYEVQDE